MENSQKSLHEVIEEQKKTIEKYTTKLRDVVAAHKSLLKEKKALEDTIKIIRTEKITSSSNDKLVIEKGSNEKDISEAELKNQLSSVVVSLSNVVAEKSRMEEGFKSHQKQLLEDKKRAENKCKELEEQIKALIDQLKHKESKSSCESLQLKKESQKNVRSSRQTTDSKDESKNLENELLVLQIKNYEKEIKNLKSELEAKQKLYESSEKKLSESIKELNKLQEIIKNLQIEHERAISNEKKRVESVEENAKKLTAVQEKMVLNLETKLAELSKTIGTYDRLRLQDQIEIHKLKEHIAFIDTGCKESVLEHQKSILIDLDDYYSVKEKFLDTKKKLQLAAQKHHKEEDLRNLLIENSNEEEMHMVYKEAYEKLKAEFDSFKNDIQYFSQGKSDEEIVFLQSQVKKLQENVKILSNKNELIKKDYKLQIKHLKKTLKKEKLIYKDMISASNTDHKARVWLLKEQLQKQRERSLALLEEKEQEIEVLQSKFLHGYKDKSNILLKSQFDGPHIVHYANELARKDVEISNLRKSKHQIEMTLRDLQKVADSTLEKHKEEKQELLNNIARLERYRTLSGEKLEYLKNIVYNFLRSDDPKWRTPLCKAIAAVLKFTDSEVQDTLSHRKNGLG